MGPVYSIVSFSSFNSFSFRTVNCTRTAHKQNQFIHYLVHCVCFAFSSSFICFVLFLFYIFLLTLILVISYAQFASILYYILIWFIFLLPFYRSRMIGLYSATRFNIYIYIDFSSPLLIIDCQMCCPCLVFFFPSKNKNKRTLSN